MESQTKTKTKMEDQTLGEYLAQLRIATGLSLRGVEEATKRDVSNAYLSQLEKGRVNKPSPSILHALATVYNVAYEDLMERAGYLAKSEGVDSGRRRGRVAAFAIRNITPEEEQALIDYLAYLRYKRKKT